MLVFIDESGINKANGYSTFALVYVTAHDCPLLEQQVLQLEETTSISTQSLDNLQRNFGNN